MILKIYNTIMPEEDRVFMQYMGLDGVSFDSIDEFIASIPEDDDTIEMIEDYILPGRGCDIGMIFAWGGLDALLQTMASQPVGTFSSQYEAKESAAQAALEETVNFFKDPTK